MGKVVTVFLVCDDICSETNAAIKITIYTPENNVTNRYRVLDPSIFQDIPKLKGPGFEPPFCGTFIQYTKLWLHEHRVSPVKLFKKNGSSNISGDVLSSHNCIVKETLIGYELTRDKSTTG